MFNSHDFQYRATLKGLEGDLAVLNLINGAKQAEIKIPKDLIPKEISPGTEFMLKMLPTEDAKENEYDSLRKLLQELIS